MASKYSLRSRTRSFGLKRSEIVVKPQMSLNITVRSWTSPPDRMYLSGSFSINAITPGERYCENVLRILRFSRSSKMTRKLEADTYDIASVVAGTTKLYHRPQRTKLKYRKPLKPASTRTNVTVAVSGRQRPNQTPKTAPNSTMKPKSTI